MIEALPTDVVRVAVVVPLFAYASYRDVLERRVRHRVWYAPVAVALVLLAVDLLLLRDPGTVLGFTVLSLAIGGALGYGFYYLGAFGGADRYALVVVALLFPVYPAFTLSGSTLPVVVPDLPVFVLSVLGNTVIVGAMYPLKLAAGNARNRDLDSLWLVFLAKKVRVDDLRGEYGRILEGPEGVSMGRSGVLSSPEGVSDVEFVHDFLDWHGEDRLRDVDDLRLPEFLDGSPWMTDDLDRDLHELEALAARDEVWISPGIPFIVPMFAGVLLALTAGDLLFLVLQLAFA